MIFDDVYNLNKKKYKKKQELGTKQNDQGEELGQVKVIHVEGVKEDRGQELVQVLDRNLKGDNHRYKKDCLNGVGRLRCNNIIFCIIFFIYNFLSEDVLKEVNISQILNAIKRGAIDPEQVITIKVMKDAGIFKRVKYGVKLLSRGAQELKLPLNFEVSDASENAIKTVKQLGGNVTCIYRTPLLLKEHLKPEKFDL